MDDPTVFTTRVIRIRSVGTDAKHIAEAGAMLRAGRLVAFPTETVYGLGANALDSEAAARIFAAKGRPANDPLIVHLASVGELPRVARDLPPFVEPLARAFWPGPLTLIVPRSDAVPPLVSAGRATVAVRVPAHPVAHALISAAGVPIAAPSANRFGHTSPTTAAHVFADLDGRIDLVLDGGPTVIGVESSVLDLSGPVPVLLRPGGVSLEALCAVLGDVVLGGSAHGSAGDSLIAPGLLQRHYAPDTAMILCVGPVEAARAWLRAEVQRRAALGQRVGALLPDEDAALLADLAVDIEPLGAAADLDAVAGRLYAALRALDARHPDVILARDVGDRGLGLAIRDRLTKAASGHVVRVLE